MREPFWLFQRLFKDWMIPIQMIKMYIFFLLVGLDNLHTSCKIVHTGAFLLNQFGSFRLSPTYDLSDLKLDNIMVTFEDPAVLGEFMNAQLDQFMQYKIDSSGRPVYRCHNNFGPLTKVSNITKIVDFGLSLRLDCEYKLGIIPIQPVHYRAPEVILGCGWRMSADIWNLGVLVCSMLLNHD